MNDPLPGMHPLFAVLLQPLAPEDSEVQKVKADIHYNDLKNTGALRRYEDGRAMRWQLQEQQQ